MRTKTDEVCICGHLRSRHTESGGTAHRCCVCVCQVYLKKRDFFGKVQPFGWDVTVESAWSGESSRMLCHYRGCTEAAARRKALQHVNGLKGRGSHLGAQVVDVQPLTEEQWTRAYGLGRM